MMTRCANAAGARVAAILAALALALTAATTSAEELSPAEYTPDVQYKLETQITDDGKMVFVGVGGRIDGTINPELRAEPGEIVQLTLVNGDGAQHDWAVPDLDAKTDKITGRGSSSVTVFRAREAGEYDYYCTVPGHRAAGMEGLLVVGEREAAAEEDDLASVVRAPDDLPEPVGDREPRELDFHLETVEKRARLADGTSYRYWTFNGTVPGPMLRVRVGDTVNVTLENAEDSTMPHSVDMHAVTGPGGGAKATQTSPGDTTGFTFKALKPGVYVYHCATPMVAHHIANGMYGLVVVEPAGGFDAVDEEFYVMQGEIFTDGEHGREGHQEFSVDKLLDEQPEYYVLNGAVGALTEQAPLEAKVGDDVRIFFGVGGPNATSSFHIIGEIFDRVYDDAAVSNEPLRDVQTTSVAPGGATMVELTPEIPGRYILVDHALARMERGLVGFLEVDGEGDPEVFEPGLQ